MWNSTREDEYYLQFNDDEADTEDPGLSERRAVLDVVQTVAFKLLVPPIVAFGCVGNVINIVVLTRKSMKSSTNRYLTCLVVSSRCLVTSPVSLSRHLTCLVVTSPVSPSTTYSTSSSLSR